MVPGGLFSNRRCLCKAAWWPGPRWPGESAKRTAPCAPAPAKCTWRLAAFECRFGLTASLSAYRSKQSAHIQHIGANFQHIFPVASQLSIALRWINLYLESRCRATLATSHDRHGGHCGAASTSTAPGCLRSRCWVCGACAHFRTPAHHHGLCW